MAMLEVQNGEELRNMADEKEPLVEKQVDVIGMKVALVEKQNEKKKEEIQLVEVKNEESDNDSEEMFNQNEEDSQKTIAVTGVLFCFLEEN